jgi:hypothetical protein
MSSSSRRTPTLATNVEEKAEEDVPKKDNESWYKETNEPDVTDWYNDQDINKIVNEQPKTNTSSNSFKVPVVSVTAVSDHEETRSQMSSRQNTKPNLNNDTDE